jgi:hypothetical protein
MYNHVQNKKEENLKHIHVFSPFLIIVLNQYSIFIFY